MLENGRRIAEATGADVELVELFALFHDCRRVNENRDPGHGRRGADFAASLCGTLLLLEPERFDLLHHACTHHTDRRTDDDITVQTCWDADRLDLGRVWIQPSRKYLSTDVAKGAAMMEWADDRAREGYVSPIAVEWLGWWK